MDTLAWLGDSNAPLPQAPARYRAAFTGLNPALFEQREGPSDQEYKEALLTAIFSPLPNALNQLNRIGGTAAPYDSQLSYDQVFRNAGYDDGVASLLGLAAGFAEPGPGELKALGDLLPVLAIIGRLPPRMAQEIVRRASPAQRLVFGDSPADWQQFHGTMRQFDTPHSDYTSMGRSGRGFYTAIDDNLDARRLRAQGYGEVREDTAILQNPFVIGMGRRGGQFVEGPARQLARPNLDAMYAYRESLRELFSNTRGNQARSNLNRVIDRLDEYIGMAERGEPIEMSFSEFRGLTDLPEMVAPNQIRSRGIEGGTRAPENYTALASDAFGFDGVISLHNDELVSFRPEHNVISDMQTAVQALERLGVTPAEMQQLLLEAGGP